MSWQRSRLVGLLLVCTALAVGIALGAGPLSDLGSRAPGADAATPTASAEPSPAAVPAVGDAFAAAAATTLYAGGLSGRPVVVLTLPGADPDIVSALAEQVGQAGGQVTATYALKRTLLDPGEKTLVDTLGEQLLAQDEVDGAGGTGLVTDGATTYDRIGQLIGRAVASARRSDPVDPGVAASLRASLNGARLLGIPAEDAEDAEATAVPPARLVLVVTGGADDVVEPVVLAGLMSGLAATSKAVVVAGPASAASIEGLRTSPPERPVTTVDGTETPSGQVSAVLALIRSWRTPGGSFGASGADGPVPLG